MQARVIAAAVLISFLAACASVENRTSAEKFTYSQNEKENAVIVLSVGAAEKCISFVTRLKLLASESPYNGPTLAFLPVDSYVVKSEFSDHHGYLHVLRLKPGSYYFAPYINNPALDMKQVPRMDFRVAAGEVVYLGEYFMDRSCGLSDSGALRDRSERDLALLKSKNPALAQAQVEKRILHVTGQMKL
jgi:hypothetical protein